MVLISYNQEELVFIILFSVILLGTLVFIITHPGNKVLDLKMKQFRNTLEKDKKNKDKKNNLVKETKL